MTILCTFLSIQVFQWVPDGANYEIVHEGELSLKYERNKQMVQRLGKTSFANRKMCGMLCRLVGIRWHFLDVFILTLFIWFSSFISCPCLTSGFLLTRLTLFLRKIELCFNQWIRRLCPLSLTGHTTISFPFTCASRIFPLNIRQGSQNFSFSIRYLQPSYIFD